MENKQSNGIVIQKKHIVIGAVIVILLLAGGITVGLNWNAWFGGQNPSAAQSEPGGIRIDENARAWDGQVPQATAETAPPPGSIALPGYPEIRIAKNTAKVQMPLRNPEGNPCYFKYTVVLDDTGEVLYESDYIAPGDAVIDVEMAKGLPEGEYNATLQISTIGLDQKTPMNGGNMHTKLIAV